MLRSHFSTRFISRDVVKMIIFLLSLNVSRQTFWFAGKVAAGTVIGTLLGEVVHLSFCFSDARVAACTGATACILSSKVPDDHAARLPLGQCI